MSRGRVVIVVVKLSLLVAGLWVLFRPESPAPNAAFHEGQLFARAFGGLLLVLAAVPFRGPPRGGADTNNPEELSWKRERSTATSPKRSAGTPRSLL